MKKLRGIQFGEGLDSSYIVAEHDENDDTPDTPILEIKVFEGIKNYSWWVVLSIINQILNRIASEVDDDEDKLEGGETCGR